MSRPTNLPPEPHLTQPLKKVLSCTGCVALNVDNCELGYPVKGLRKDAYGPYITGTIRPVLPCPNPLSWQELFKSPHYDHV